MSRLPLEHLYIDLLPPTPLVDIRLSPGSPPIWCKLEFLNPSGSTKDRIARYILEKAWREGKLSSGHRVVEASSGSSSIALALVCAQMGLRFCAIMPEGVSKERSLMIKAYGGEVIISPKSEGMEGAIRIAEQKAEEGAFYTNQFANPDNARAHKVTTGQEILSQIPGGVVDVLVCGVGTGGTIVGLYSAFKEMGCDIRAYAARPLSNFPYGGVECSSFSTKIAGVVEGFSKIYIPEKMPYIQQISVDEVAAIETTKLLIKKGFPVGPSSGLNFLAAQQVAEELGDDLRVVTVFPDRMERYFSTELFQ